MRGDSGLGFGVSVLGSGIEGLGLKWNYKEPYEGSAAFYGWMWGCPDVITYGGCSQVSMLGAKRGSKKGR